VSGLRFSYDNVTFRYDEERKKVVVSGDITNLSGRNLSSTVFKMVLFVRSRPVGSVHMVIRAISDGQTKTFEEAIEEIDLAPLVLPEMLRPEILRYEIYPEGGY
jgi:hypothetical protein